jgi:hypothetical protein
MRGSAAHVVLAVCAALIAATGALGAEIAREDLGRSVKLKVLVDKVMQPEADWVTEEWMVREAAEAGFNVYSPRHGFDRLGEVQKVTQWCEKYGIYHMPWMRGTLEAPEGPQADGKRMVWSDGSEQPLWSPNAREFWRWTERYIVEYARMSAQDEHIIGVFLDYENYAPGSGQGICYDLSYDDLILREFARAKGIQLPDLALAERKPWLQQQGLHEEFAQFQIEGWRRACRRLRELVDRYNPRFQFCIYPAPGSLFIVEATYPTWATRQAPLILADAVTYGRPGRLTAQQQALEINRRSLQTRMDVPRQARIPFMYLGGIDPVVGGADPEFCGKNAVMIAETTDGYWVFYEGPTYKGEHPEYFRWFTWANQAIDAGRFDAWREPRETPDACTLPALRPLAPDEARKVAEYPTVRLRGGNVLLVHGAAGRPFQVDLQHQPVSDYTADLVWAVRARDWKDLASGTIPQGERGTVRFTPEADGLYGIVVSAGRCAYSVLRSTAPLGLYTGEGLALIYGAERLYFDVPESVDRFTVAFHTSGAETARVNVYDPQGHLAGSGQTSTSVHQVQIEADREGRPAGVWALEVTGADEGTLEDVVLEMDPKLPQALSLTPEHVLGFAD